MLTRRPARSPRGAGDVWTSWDDISGVYLLSRRHPDPRAGGVATSIHSCDWALNRQTHGASRPSPPFPRLLYLCRCGVGAPPSSRFASPAQLADVVRDVGGAGELLAVG